MEFIISCIKTLISFIHEFSSFSSSSLRISWIDNSIRSSEPDLKGAAFNNNSHFPRSLVNATNFCSKALIFFYGIEEIPVDSLQLVNVCEHLH